MERLTTPLMTLTSISKRPPPEKGDNMNNEIKDIIADIMEARELIVAENKPRGIIECPKCKGQLYYTVASINGHVHASCKTEKCLNWME